MDARDYEDAYQRDDKPREVKSNRAWRLECESLHQQLAECERERDVFKQCDRTSYDALATVTKQRDELEGLLRDSQCEHKRCMEALDMVMRDPRNAPVGEAALAELGADKTEEGS